MDINRNIFPIAFEPVEELIDAAYISDDFTLADTAIARNAVKETGMISRLVNGAMDAYCWSSGRGVSHMLSRTSHPGYTLQLTDFYQGRAIGDIDIKHGGGNFICPTAYVRWAWRMRIWASRKSLPSVSASISRRILTNSSAAIAMDSRSMGSFSLSVAARSANYQVMSVRRQHGNPPPAILSGEG